MIVENTIAHLDRWSMAILGQLSSCLVIAVQARCLVPKPHAQNQNTTAPHKRAEQQTAEKDRGQLQEIMRVLISAFSHFANTNSRQAVTPDPTQTIPNRSLLKLRGIPRHAAYAIAIVSTGPTTKKTSSCSASASHRYSGFMAKDY
jgi:hypothetical protein